MDAEDLTAIETSDPTITHIGVRCATRSEATTLGMETDDVLVYVVTRTGTDTPEVVPCSTYYINHRAPATSAQMRSLIVEQLPNAI